MKRLQILVFLVGASCVYADEPKHANAGEVSATHVEALPVPPQQHTAWKLPTTINDPEGTITAIINLAFKAGMADPRGLPYHHVKVMEGEKLIAARGWVLPAHQNQHFAIAWNGLIYPVAEIGELADLKADLKLLEEKQWFYDEPFDNYQDESLGDVIAKFRGAPRMMYPSAASYLLLRLGYPVAQREHREYHPNDDPFANEEDAADSEGKDDGMIHLPRWTIADYGHQALADFARITRDDGVAAWIEDDYPLAAQRLSLMDALWSEAKALSPKEATPGMDPFAAGPTSLDELNSGWRDLLVDARRRLSPAPPIGDSMIEQAIASWDQITEWSEQNPPPSFRLVASSGPAAIKPLLDCLEHDQRWTRVARLDDDNYWQPRVLRVRDLALSALNQVLEFSFEEMPGGDTPTESTWYDEVAAKYRMHCERYDYQWGPELWYRILADPQGDLNDQLKAVNAMVTPVAELSNPYFHWFSAEYGGSGCESSEFAKPSEMLRDRTNPSVLELMKRVWQRERERVDEALKNGEPEQRYPVTTGSFPLHIRDSAHHIVHYMEDWSPGNVELLRSHYQWLLQGLSKEREKENSFTYSLLQMCEETLIRRFWADDDTAIADYQELFRAGMSHGNVPVSVMQVIPASPELDKLVAEAFLNKEAPLSFVHQPWTLYDSKRDGIAWNSPMLKLPSYRQALIEALQCTTVQATLTLTPEKAELLFHASRDKGPETLNRRDGTQPEQTTTEYVEIRVCDLIAHFLTPGVGYHAWSSDDSKEAAWLAPDFHLVDSLEQRNEAIAEWIKRLKTYH